PRWQAFCAAAALVAAFLFTYAMVSPPPYWPVIEASGWIPYLLLGWFLMLCLVNLRRDRYVVPDYGTPLWLFLFAWYSLHAAASNRSTGLLLLVGCAYIAWYFFVRFTTGREELRSGSFCLTLLSIASAAV